MRSSGFLNSEVLLTGPSLWRGRRRCLSTLEPGAGPPAGRPCPSDQSQQGSVTEGGGEVSEAVAVVVGGGAGPLRLLCEQTEYGAS